MLDWVKFWLQNSIYQVQWKVVYKVINSNKSVGNLEPKIRNILGNHNWDQFWKSQKSDKNI